MIINDLWTIDSDEKINFLKNEILKKHFKIPQVEKLDHNIFYHESTNKLYNLSIDYNNSIDDISSFEYENKELNKEYYLIDKNTINFTNLHFDLVNNTIEQKESEIKQVESDGEQSDEEQLDEEKSDEEEPVLDHPRSRYRFGGKKNITDTSLEEFNYLIKQFPNIIISHSVYSSEKIIFGPNIQSLEIISTTICEPIKYFPPNLKRLKLQCRYPFELDNLPECIEELYIYDDISVKLPKKIKKIVTEHNYYKCDCCDGNDVDSNDNKHIPNIVPQLESLLELEYLDMSLSCYSGIFKLPPNIKTLILPDKFHGDFSSLPDSIEILVVNTCKKIINKKFPSNIKVLYFTDFIEPEDNEVDEDNKVDKYNEDNEENKDDYFYYMDNLVRYESLRELVIYDKANVLLKSFPPNLKILKLPDDLVCEIACLPSKLEYVSFGEAFGLENNIKDLPDSIKVLIFSNNSNINYDIEKLPKSLEMLKMGTRFNSKINFENCENLKELLFPGLSFYNNPLDNLPESLEKILLGEKYSHPIDNLPPGLKYLEFNMWNEEFDFQMENLPSGLTHLFLGCGFNQNLDYLPAGLEVLVIQKHNRFNKELNNLPVGLKILYIGSECRFNNELDNLPGGLEYLYLNNEFDRSLKNLPQGLKFLRIGKKFKNPDNLKNIPDTIERLDLVNSKIYGLEKLPSNLKFLSLSRELLIPVNQIYHLKTFLIDFGGRKNNDDY